MTFRKFAALSLAAAAILGLTACGEPVEVPPAHVGKILTADGFRKDTLPPSKFRLDPCFTLCDKLVVVEAADFAAKETMKLFMPKDQLNLDIEVRGVFAIENNAETVNKVFDRISALEQSKYLSVIPMAKVYETYATQVIRETVRSIMTEYTIQQVMESREAIGQRLLQEIRGKLAASPIQAVQFGLADIQPPEVIVKAKEVAASREIAIQQEEANKQIELKKAEAAIEIAEKDKIVRLKKAEAILAENQKVAESVNEKYLMYRYLEVLEEAAKSDSTIFFPLEMTQSAGLQNRIFGSKPTAKD